MVLAESGRIWTAQSVQIWPDSPFPSPTPPFSFKKYVQMWPDSPQFIHILATLFRPDGQLLMVHVTTEFWVRVPGDKCLSTISHCFSLQKIRCQRKEPCRLFSVRKNLSRPSADEVSMSSLCQCPKKSRCPKHHLDVGVIPGKVYTDTTVRTYSGYCM